MLHKLFNVRVLKKKTKRREKLETKKMEKEREEKIKLRGNSPHLCPH